MNKTEYNNIGETLLSETLPNGLRINVIPKPGYSTAYACVAVNYGGACVKFSSGGEDFDTPAGIAHFLEHKMFDMPEGVNALTELTSNGADPNAFTSTDVTCYYFSCTDNFYENLRLLIKLVTVPYFTPETVQKEQGIIGQEISMGNDYPSLKLYYNLLSLLYKNNPSKDKVIGTVESIAEITDKTLYDCHRLFYVPSNMILCVEGNVDCEKIADIARELFPAELSPVAVPDYGAGDGLEPYETEITEKAPISNTQFLIGAKIKAEPDGISALRQDMVSALAMKVLCGGSSPFYSKLYTSGLLNKDFDYECEFTSGIGTVIIGGESDRPREVLQELKSEVAKVRREGFDSTLFERCKKSFYGARLRGLEDFDNVCVALAYGFFRGYCAFESEDILAGVTKEECEKFITENLADERLVLSVLEVSGSTNTATDEEE